MTLHDREPAVKGVRIRHEGSGVWDLHCLKCQKGWRGVANRQQCIERAKEHHRLEHDHPSEVRLIDGSPDAR